ncbi:MAG: MBL fold metallo-hydrolase [Treponema sp.]|nr:MBL fold metallo-hydrolase [Treponema sp.]
MQIIFWGVRGSIPTPLTPEQVQAKITAAVQRITPKDIASEDARERFVASLPSWLYGTTGGNTPCVEVKTDSGAELVFDAGSGIRVMGKKGAKPADNHYNIFLSHFHWDHLQGFPFFDAVYNPDVSIDLYSTFPAAERLIRAQMLRPYYPVTFDACTKNFRFHTIEQGKPFLVDGHEICCCKMSHPGNSYSYAVTENGKKFVYATDVELSQKDFERTAARTNVFKNADIIVLDSQYTVAEAHQKENWGHSAFCYAVDFAVHWNIKTIYLFHHEPTYDDKKLNSILLSARWYAEYIEHPEIQIYLATENMVISL